MRDVLDSESLLPTSGKLPGDLFPLSFAALLTAIGQKTLFRDLLRFKRRNFSRFLPSCVGFVPKRVRFLSIFNSYTSPQILCLKVRFFVWPLLKSLLYSDLSLDSFRRRQNCGFYGDL